MTHVLKLDPWIFNKTFFKFIKIKNRFKVTALIAILDMRRGDFMVLVICIQKHLKVVSPEDDPPKLSSVNLVNTHQAHVRETLREVCSCVIVAAPASDHHEFLLQVHLPLAQSSSCSSVISPGFTFSTRDLITRRLPKSESEHQTVQPRLYQIFTAWPASSLRLDACITGNTVVML